MESTIYGLLIQLLEIQRKIIIIVFLQVKGITRSVALRIMQSRRLTLFTLILRFERWRLLIKRFMIWLKRSG